ncbi:hypothetical protein [Rhizohabitans arisaemae]|uniref:hypothetical protein n=1 Tax=Rhizohabitans arisaemae TaxID=2720610 RepID=UPI0024B17F37|nr:hypothetical protein [Rhizohabitans arisaemae]
MTAVLEMWGDVRSGARAAARSRRLTDATPDGFPVPPPVQAWEIHELLGEMSSGTRPCTSCCTQCSGRCCNATC